MAFNYASLADGQLPNAKGTLYTSVAQTAIMEIRLVEPNGAARTVNIYLKRSGSSSRRLIPANTLMDSSSGTSAAVIEVVGDGRPIEMSAGDVIEGDASAATAIDYAIYGATRSAEA